MKRHFNQVHATKKPKKTSSSSILNEIALNEDICGDFITETLDDTDDFIPSMAAPMRFSGILSKDDQLQCCNKAFYTHCI